MNLRCRYRSGRRFIFLLGLGIPGQGYFYCHRRVKNNSFAGFFPDSDDSFLSEFVDFICKYIIIRIIGFPIVHPELRFQLHIVIQVTDCFPGIQKGRQAVKKAESYFPVG